MKTRFNVEININDFEKDYKKYGKDSFLCPIGYNSISDFIRVVPEIKSKCSKIPISFGFYEAMWFNIGDTVLLNNIYYKVINKTFFANTNTINYELIYE